MTVPHSGREPFYRRLDLGPGASREEIVHAYRRLAHGSHPDAHPGDPDAARRFREITEAYEGLTDPSRSADHERAVQPVRVIVRPYERGVSEALWPVQGVQSVGPTISLGVTPQPTPDIPLRAGPVRVELPSQEPSIGGGEPERGLIELMARILSAWGRP